MTDLHVLHVPSWYVTDENLVYGSFFKDQALAVQRQGVTVGAVYADLKGLNRIKSADLLGRRFHISRRSEDGIPTVRLHGWLVPRSRRLSQDLWVHQTQRLIKEYVRRFGAPDLIHAQCVHHGGVAALEARSKWRIPFLVTEHFSGYAQNVMSERMLDQAREVFLHADGLAAVSSALAKDIRIYAGRRKFIVIPNMVDTAYFTLPPEPRLAEAFTFLFVGNLMANKGVDKLLRAFATAFKSDSPVRLRIGGDGYQRAELESLASKLGIENRVTFLGVLPRQTVREEMWAANAFVLASYVETFGIVLIEAMSTGLPVVVTRCGGPEEFVNDKVGRLVASGNVEELKHAMAETHSNRNQWSEAAPDIREYVKVRFSDNIVAAKLIDTYQQLVK